MKAIVTGGAGFIGSHLVDELITRGIAVHVIDNMSTGQFVHVHPLAVLHQIDIGSQSARKLILQEKPDFLFHLAAQASVQKSIREPGYDADVNIRGTINLLEACCEAKVKKFIFASTAGVYGNLHKELLSEEDPIAPISCYGLSKWTAESYIRLFHQLHGLSYTILRYANVYGPRQSASGEGGVIAIFIAKIKRGLPIVIYGDGKQTRDFIYVKDIVNANVAAMERGEQETLQISSGSATSILDLLTLLEQIHGSPANRIHLSERDGDIRHSCLNNERAQNVLRWSPQVHIAAGLSETYQD